MSQVNDIYSSAIGHSICTYSMDSNMSLWYEASFRGRKPIEEGGREKEAIFSVPFPGKTSFRIGLIYLWPSTSICCSAILYVKKNFFFLNSNWNFQVLSIKCSVVVFLIPERYFPLDDIVHHVSEQADHWKYQLFNKVKKCQKVMRTVIIFFLFLKYF